MAGLDSGCIFFGTRGIDSESSAEFGFEVVWAVARHPESMNVIIRKPMNEVFPKSSLRFAPAHTNLEGEIRPISFYDLLPPRSAASISLIQLTEPAKNRGIDSES